MKEKRFQLKNYAPILLMLACAAVLGALLGTGVISLDTIPEFVQEKPVLAFAVIMALYLAKGFSGVILYNALVIAVSLIFPMGTALLTNALGTAVALSVSYIMGSRTNISLDTFLDKHPKMKKYFRATQQFGFVACFAIHMAGLSMEVLGVLFGIMHIGFWRYLISSWLAIIPGMVCFTIAGNELSFRSPLFWIVLVIDLCMMAFGFLYTKKHILPKAGENTES